MRAAHPTRMLKDCQRLPLRWPAIMVLVSCLAAALAAAGQEPVRPGEHGLKVGEKASAFRLQSAEGQEYTLTNLLARGKLALVFYRSAGW